MAATLTPYEIIEELPTDAEFRAFTDGLRERLLEAAEDLNLKPVEEFVQRYSDMITERLDAGKASTADGGGA
ncbi:hypothetical protein [Streptomyces lichenis]|uniref:Uncharacterized protein n=1 Tax=Streptomyces lichenis TaxID=2306967 RepID=A0ABT0I8B5_9ACTN|nr:hypothetical protein [Streptomyces lichenis]MCK8677551.1 hypothetical protein [Streptomyces lichenis]